MLKINGEYKTKNKKLDYDEIVRQAVPISKNPKDMQYGSWVDRGTFYTKSEKKSKCFTIVLGENYGKH